jgi:hypothetical protein
MQLCQLLFRSQRGRSLDETTARFAQLSELNENLAHRTRTNDQLMIKMTIASCIFFNLPLTKN